jgi:hypothetical protein
MKDLYKIPEGSVVETFEDKPSQQDSSKSTQPEVETDPSELESFLRGGAQSASAGFADELTAGVESALTDKTYEQSRQEAREAYKRAKDVNSKSYLAGELAGGLASLLVPGGALAKLGLAGKGVGGAVKAGGILGGLTGLGASEADLTKLELGEAAKDTVAGGGFGIATGGVLGAAGKAIDAYKGSALRKLVQSGKNIDDPIAAQRIAGEISEDLGGKLASTPGKLAKRRDAVVDQASFDEMRFPSPKLDSEKIASIAEGFTDSPYTLSKLKKILQISQKADISPEEYRSLNTLLNDIQYTREGQKLNNPEIRDLVAGIKKQISENLPNEWKIANKQYSEFLSDVIEPSVLEGGKFSRVGADRTEVKAQDMLSELLNEVGKGNKDALYKLEQLKSGLQGFDKKSPGLLKETSGLDPSSLGKEITEGARSIQALTQYQTPLGTATPGLLDLVHPKIGLTKLALKNQIPTKAFGMVAKTEKSFEGAYAEALDLVKRYTPSQLSDIADSLMSTQATARLGQQLKTALQNNDPIKKSASIFSALQNPQARAILMPATQEPPVKQE